MEVSIPKYPAQYLPQNNSAWFITYDLDEKKYPLHLAQHLCRNTITKVPSPGPTTKKTRRSHGPRLSSKKKKKGEETKEKDNIRKKEKRKKREINLYILNCQEKKKKKKKEENTQKKEKEKG